MFAAAYQSASAFTKPIIISSLRQDGSCASGVGSFVVVNDEGWILTAAHVFTEFSRLAEGKAKLTKHLATVADIENDGTVPIKLKKKRLHALGKPDPAWVRDFSFWWATDGVTVQDVTILQSADIALARLHPFDKSAVTTFPVFKDPSKTIASGTSLCRLGFPFHSIQPSYDDVKRAFVLPPGTFPMVFFPNEGILTRQIIVNASAAVFEGYLETSSPGLMGQSGGPVFDTRGTVWGIQSHTSHLPLGFSPPVPGGKAGEKEHQFLNVGRAVHPSTVVGLLTMAKVKFSLSSY